MGKIRPETSSRFEPERLPDDCSYQLSCLGLCTNNSLFLISFIYQNKLQQSIWQTFFNVNIFLINNEQQLKPFECYSGTQSLLTYVKVEVIGRGSYFLYLYQKLIMPMDFTRKLTKRIFFLKSFCLFKKKKKTSITFY